MIFLSYLVRCQLHSLDNPFIQDTHIHSTTQPSVQKTIQGPEKPAGCSNDDEKSCNKPGNSTSSPAQSSWSKTPFRKILHTKVSVGLELVSSILGEGQDLPQLVELLRHQREQRPADAQKSHEEVCRKPRRLWACAEIEELIRWPLNLTNLNPLNNG